MSHLLPLVIGAFTRDGFPAFVLGTDLGVVCEVFSEVPFVGFLRKRRMYLRFESYGSDGAWSFPAGILVEGSSYQALRSDGTPGDLSIIPSFLPLQTHTVEGESGKVGDIKSLYLDFEIRPESAHSSPYKISRDFWKTHPVTGFTERLRYSLRTELDPMDSNHTILLAFALARIAWDDWHSD